jgi:hypothetical protein
MVYDGPLYIYRVQLVSFVRCLDLTSRSDGDTSDELGRFHGDQSPLQLYLSIKFDKTGLTVVRSNGHKGCPRFTSIVPLRRTCTEQCSRCSADMQQSKARFYAKI